MKQSLLYEKSNIFFPQGLLKSCLSQRWKKAAFFNLSGVSCQAGYEYTLYLQNHVVGQSAAITVILMVKVSYVFHNIMQMTSIWGSHNSKYHLEL